MQPEPTTTSIEVVNRSTGQTPPPGHQSTNMALDEITFSSKRAENIARASFFSAVSPFWRHGEPLPKARSKAEQAQAEFREASNNSRRNQAIARHRLLSDALRSAERVPHNVLGLKQRVLSTLFKVILITGDSAVLGGIWWRAGLPLWLAVIAGLSTGTTIVATGAMTGRRLQSTGQRRQRGPITGDVPNDLADLYSDRTGHREWMWPAVAIVVGLTALVAVTMIGEAVGDPRLLSVSSGLFAAATVVGSAAAEAYGTNLAADRVKRRQSDLKKSANTLRTMERRIGEAEAHASFAQSEESHAYHEAVATALRSHAHSEPTTSNPEPLERPSTPPLRASVDFI